MEPEEVPFIAGLDAKMDDWDLRLVYADWLGERGRLDEEFAQRWMVENRKHPGSPKNPQNQHWSYDATVDRFRWRKARITYDDYGQEDSLPVSVWSRIPLDKHSFNKAITQLMRDVCWYKTRLEAEAALVVALKQARPNL